MKKVLFSAIAVVCATVSFANEATTPAKGAAPRKLTPEIREKLKGASYQIFGGQVRKEGSAKGTVAFINAQKKVSLDQIKPVFAFLDARVHVMWKWVDAESVNSTNPRGDIAKLGCPMGVAIVDDAKIPALLVAPEESWAVVNVAALSGEGVDAAKLADRVRKEVLRAFALAGGCAFMARGGETMRDLTSTDALDGIKRTVFGVEVMNHLATTLPAHGITPWRQVNYRTACKEGWAPSPTNDVQRKIWDVVHELPSNPIKIKYDPKRDK